MTTDYKVAEVELSYKNRVPYKERKKVQTSLDAYNLLINNHDDDTIDYKETFKVLYLNQASQVVGCFTLSQGGITSTCVDVRNILQGALLTNAVAMVLAHNHPSGLAVPTGADITVTKRIGTALQAVEVQLVDHIVVAEDDFVSMVQSGYRFDDYLLP